MWRSASICSALRLRASAIGLRPNRLTAPASFLEDVRNAIAEELIAGEATAENIAMRLNLSPRTLHRRLVENGSAFRKVKDDLLRTRAEKLLIQQKITLGEVSYLLGYSEPANFNRAFRRWTGTTPAQWREMRV